MVNGPNRYAYVGSDPLQKTDSRGKSAKGVVVRGILADLATLDPSDFVWYKWAGHAGLFASAAVLDWILLSEKKSEPQSSKRPKNCPPGTIGIDKAKKKYGWSTGQAHDIKDNAYGGKASPKDWVGVAPDGTVGINDGDGNWQGEGHWTGLTND